MRDVQPRPDDIVHRGDLGNRQGFHQWRTRLAVRSWIIASGGANSSGVILEQRVALGVNHQRQARLLHQLQTLELLGFVGDAQPVELVLAPLHGRRGEDFEANRSCVRHALHELALQ